MFPPTIGLEAKQRQKENTQKAAAMEKTVLNT